MDLRPNAYEALALPLSYLGKLSERMMGIAPHTRGARRMPGELSERDTRIELAFPAWEADVLPLY